MQLHNTCNILTAANLSFEYWHSISSISHFQIIIINNINNISKSKTILITNSTLLGGISQQIQGAFQITWADDDLTEAGSSTSYNQCHAESLLLELLSPW